MDELEDILGTDLRLLAGISWGGTFLIGLIGNLFIISVIRRIMKQRQNIPNSLIHMLSVIDLINVLVTYIQPLIVYIHGRYLDRSVLCRIQTVSVIFFNSFSVLVLLGIICERYYAVAKPYSYQEHMAYNGNKIYVFVAFCLLCATGISLPIILGTGHSELYYPGTYCMFTLKKSNPHDRWNLMFYTILIFTAIVITVIASLMSCHTMQKMKTFREQHSTSQRGSSHAHSEEYLYIRLCIVSLVVFSVIWIPLLVTLCIALCGSHVPSWYILLSFRLAALHSVVNPWLYPILRKRFRNAMTWYVASVFSCLTCGKISKPENTLSDILSNTQAPAANREEPQRHKSEANENIEGDNIMLDIAQRNILDYVDAPASVYGNEGELCDVNVENNIENISNDHNVITHNAKNDDESLHDQLKEQERQ